MQALLVVIPLSPLRVSLVSPDRQPRQSERYRSLGRCRQHETVSWLRSTTSSDYLDGLLDPSAYRGLRPERPAGTRQARDRHASSPACRPTDRCSSAPRRPAPTSSSSTTGCSGAASRCRSSPIVHRPACRSSTRTTWRSPPTTCRSTPTPSTATTRCWPTRSAHLEREPAFAHRRRRPTAGSTAFGPDGVRAGGAARRASAAARAACTFPTAPSASARVGIVSGAAPTTSPTPIDAGLDAFVTGEPAERAHGDRRASGGIHFFAAGHHATETLRRAPARRAAGRRVRRAARLRGRREPDLTQPSPWPGGRGSIAARGPHEPEEHHGSRHRADHDPAPPPSRTCSAAPPSVHGPTASRCCARWATRGRRPPTREVGEIVSEIGRGFLDLGLEPGDRACILAGTRPEWTYVDFALASAGRRRRPDLPDELAGGVPVHRRELRGAARSSARTPSRWRRSPRVRDDLPSLETIVVIEADGAPEDALTLATLRERGRGRDAAELEARADGGQARATRTPSSTPRARPARPRAACSPTATTAPCSTSASSSGVLGREEEEVTYLYLPLAHSYALLIQLLTLRPRRHDRLLRRRHEADRRRARRRPGRPTCRRCRGSSRRSTRS